MNQLSLIPMDETPNELNIPPLEIGPISHSLGQIWHVLRPGSSVSVEEITDIQVSPRIRELLYRLSNGEKIILTKRRKLNRPNGVDGILQEKEDGNLKWLSHAAIDAFQTDVSTRGWKVVAADIATRWDGKFSFRAESINADMTVSTGNEGLRPPQIGALHSIGAHWSLSHQAATIVMPTGTGKTETMLATLAAYVRKPLLVVVPWDLLRSQTSLKFLTFGLLRQLGVLAPDAPNPVVGVITKRPSTVTDLDIFESCNVVISTMSSLGGDKVSQLLPEISNRIGVLILDEAHHAPAKSWSILRKAFSERPILQFTATPFRRDKQLVDGTVIYNYPLRAAQQDGYFKSISFEPVYGLDQDIADELVAQTALARLRDDIKAGHNHILMARCADINRATSLHEKYCAAAPEFAPLLVHSELPSTGEQVEKLRSGRSRVVVCINMLGEGFDLPQLKIAAVHDMHRSLAILLQFTGRFTRTSSEDIGNATVVANIADPNVSGALERLYSEDADWNELLSEMSSEAVREHAELVEFLNASRRLDTETDDEISISHQLLRPPLGTLIYEADTFHPRRFHAGLPADLEVRRVWLHETSNTLFFVTRKEPRLRWTRSRELRDRTWHLFILHYSSERKLLFLSSTDHSSLFDKLATSVGAKSIISGDIVFRALGRIKRLILQNIGVKKHGRRNLSFATYTGADVAEALSITERAGSVKNNISGIGWENGEHVTIGCSLKGRIWSREQGTIPAFVQWCAKVADKIQDDDIKTSEIISNVLIPEEVEALPEKEILSIDWPLELLRQSEERIILSNEETGDDGLPVFLFDVVVSGVNRNSSEVRFELQTGNGAVWGSFSLTVGGTKGFTVKQIGGQPVTIKAGVKSYSLSEYLSDYPPLIRFVDLSELDGNLLIHPQEAQELVIPNERFEVWDWHSVDIGKESLWKDGVERRDSIQWHVAQHYISAGFDVVFDDDSAGEAADLICLKEETDHIRLALVHCKFSGGEVAGERVKDVVEVCSQAIRSAKWKWKFRDLTRHINGRESRLATSQRLTRFLTGRAAEVGRIAKSSRFKEVRAEILIVQPGLSVQNQTPDQSAVLAAAYTYLKETIGVDLDIICSP